MASMVMSDEVERLRAALGRRKLVRDLILGFLAGVAAIYVFLVVFEATRLSVPAEWWGKIVTTPTEIGLSKLKEGISKLR